MKKISTLLILLSFVFSSSAFREFLKIHSLADHFQDHSRQDKKVSLAAFLIGHYVYDEGNDKDADEDNKLPFKSTDPASLFSFISTIPDVHFPIVHLVHQYPRNEFPLTPDDIISSQFHAAIWQPPRNC